MSLKDQNILFFTRTMKLGGTENVVLQMCEILQPYVNKIVVCSCGGVNVEKLNILGIKHYEIPDIDNKRPTTMVKVLKKIPQIIKWENITIVHTHHRMATFYMYILNRTNNVKIISTLHGTFSDKKLLTKIAYNNIDIIACGNIVKEAFVQNYGINANHITVINNAIKKDESNIEKIRCLYNLGKEYKKVGYIGRLSPEKGVQIFVEAISLVTKINPKIFFVIVGTGELEDDLKKAVKERGLENVVAFLGYRRDAQNVIKQIDITVLPSFTEGLPLTPIESFAQGKPIVATRVGGTAEIVKNGSNGILVPAGEPKALAEGILKILKNEEDYEKMSKGAVQSFENKFSYDRFENELLVFYKSICKDGM